jgi:hypothetical protein
MTDDRPMTEAFIIINIFLNGTQRNFFIGENLDRKEAS